MSKMLFINLSTGKVVEKELPNDLIKLFIGGIGIGGRVIYEYLEPGLNPLGPNNMLGFGTGPLTLSGAYCACRFTVMGKSPLTGFWGSASCGGSFANALKASGFDFLFITGRAEHPVYITIQDGEAKIKDGRKLWGRDTVETEDIIREDEGNEKLKVACIGPAGEKLAKIAAIINDGGRAAARSGFGALMGSKNLKAVACYGSKKPNVYDPERVKELMKEMYENSKNNYRLRELSNAGTCSAVEVNLATHDTPIKNWAGTNVKDFPEDKWERVSWSTLKRYVIGKYYCPGCPIGCGGWVKVEEGRYALEKAHKPEYETIAAFGPLCLNDNLESIIYANDLCNRYGLDTISAGATIAFAIECYEKGILTKEDTNGLELRWGDDTAIVELLKKMCLREGIGDLLADGAGWAAKRIGKGSERFSMDICGEMIPMHDPRYAVGWGISYIVDPEPAKHMRGHNIERPGVLKNWLVEKFGVASKVDRYDVSEKRIKWQVISSAWYKSVFAAGLCVFGHDLMEYPVLEVLNAVTGFDFTIDNLIEVGLRINTLLHAFNLREGWKPNHYTLPPRVAGHPPLPEGPLKGVTIDFNHLKKQYYKAMGWDPDTGNIAAERIRELKLDDIVKF
jgi:aldehyde:ferredoxin oxidoreductase